MKKTNIMLAGEGGQGIQLISKVFSEACLSIGLEVMYIPTFGVEQRGTPSIASITISEKELRYSEFEKADYLVVLSARAAKAVGKFTSPSTEIIFDSSTTSVSDFDSESTKFSGIPATLTAKEKFGQRSFNILVLGYLAKLFEIKSEVVWDLIEKNLGKKLEKGDLRQKNHDAFDFGYALEAEKDNFSKAVFKPKHRSVLYRGHGKKGEIVPNRCKGCGLCIVKCPVGALSFGSDLGVFTYPVPVVDLEKCIACGNCRQYCPDGAISFEKE